MLTKMEICIIRPPVKRLENRQIIIKNLAVEIMQGKDKLYEMQNKLIAEYCIRQVVEKGIEKAVKELV